MSDGIMIITMSGLLMGLASSLHCAGQCGGIATSLLLATSGQGSTPATRAATLISTQLGRATTYMLAGAAVGLAGESFSALLSLAGAQPALRIASALALVLSGLSIAGILPSVTGFDRPLQAVLARLRSKSGGGSPHPVSFMLGMSLGLAPCAMVYNGLMTAMLTGSLAGGASFMAAFGLGTIPSVALTAFGLVSVSRINPRNKRQIRALLGASLALAGIASGLYPAATLASLCLQS
jgi:uncharacterized protein